MTSTSVVICALVLVIIGLLFVLHRERKHVARFRQDRPLPIMPTRASTESKTEEGVTYEYLSTPGTADTKL